MQVEISAFGSYHCANGRLYVVASQCLCTSKSVDLYAGNSSNLRLRSPSSKRLCASMLEQVSQDF